MKQLQTEILSNLEKLINFVNDYRTELKTVAALMGMDGEQTLIVYQKILSAQQYFFSCLFLFP